MYGFGRRKKKRAREKPTGIWLSSQLDKQIQILEPSQTEADLGGFEQTYTTLKTVWGKVTQLSHNAIQRWSSTEGYGSVTHEFIFRRSALSDLHVAFSSAFGSGLDVIPDLQSAKKDLYLMLEQGSTVKGRLFKVSRVRNMDDERREYISVLAEEIEEHGTGLPGSSY